MSASLCVLLALVSAAVETPKVLDDRLQLELILQEPDLVTPVAVTAYGHGVLVVESHTHFRPQGYQGPPHDRILYVDARKLPATKSVFFEGTKYTMGLAAGPDKWVYVATRSEIFRIQDADGDGKAELREEISHLETKGNYPHNGLSGFAFRDGEVYFGFGENLGATYDLVTRTGEKLSGGGEGGNIYACRPDGSKLRRVATGFWNPFHVAFDSGGNLFTVDNDPDSRPPCRLIHVVEGGDYGFKFRNGRKGIHPFTAWNGELPGTLPMIAGTGEAPCAIVFCTSLPFTPDFAGDLLVTSWGDHRIERYHLAKRGASFSAEMKPLVVGGENFRPVGMAISGGDLYFSDWVDKSYPLHGKGRLWRLSLKDGDDYPSESRSTVLRPRLHSPSPERRRSYAEELWAEQLKAKSTDPFLWNEVALHLAGSVRDQSPLDAASAQKLLADFVRPDLPDTMIWAAVAAKNADAANMSVLAPHLLAHADPRVKLLGVMWAGEERMKERRADVERVLTEPGLTRELFESCLAALSLIDGGTPAGSILSDPKQESAGEQYVVQLLRNGSTLPGVRRFALKALRPDHPQLTSDLLARLAADSDPVTRIEAIRTVRERPSAERTKMLREIARSNRPTTERLEALIGLSPENGDKGVLDEVARSGDGPLETAVERMLRAAPPADAPALKPQQIPPGGDAANGERLFFNPRIASCYKCHEYEGRGASIGPALTTLARGTSRERFLQSLLEPSREIAPQYVPWTITTVDGLQMTGVYVGEEVDGTQRYADIQGKIHRIHPRQIEEREAAKQSIMPADFGRVLTAEELRDLAAFLSK
jgi:putative membrane-bound dehydrogenase-like protein